MSDKDAAAFADRVTELNNMAKRCAEETVYRASLYGDDRDTILRAVIGRLKASVGAYR
jgi:hypothetical protein